MKQKVCRVMKEIKRFRALTKRKKEEVAPVAKGIESKEIAKLLFNSSHTVEQHRRNNSKKVELRI